MTLYIFQKVHMLLHVVVLVTENFYSQKEKENIKKVIDTFPPYHLVLLKVILFSNYTNEF